MGAAGGTPSPSQGSADLCRQTQSPRQVSSDACWLQPVALLGFTPLRRLGVCEKEVGEPLL